mgnify:CR=1 FL=1
MLVALLIKLGLAPMHRWFPSVLADLDWGAALLLLTWQKLAPLRLVYGLGAGEPALLWFSGLRGLVGAVGALNQRHTLPLLAYSSIGHIGWVLGLFYCGASTACVYVALYLRIVIPLVIRFRLAQVSRPKLMSALVRLGPLCGLTAALLLRLAGLPPFSGFMAKALAISALIPVNSLLALVLVGCSALRVGFYLHLTRLLLVAPSRAGRRLQVSPTVARILALVRLPGLAALPLYRVF